MSRPKETTQLHAHHWVDNGLYEKRCTGQYFGDSCIAILVSEPEWKRRDEEYQSYLDLVRTTPAYLNFMDIRENGIAKKLLKEVEQRLEKDEYLPKPHFPDPQTFPYVIESAENSTGDTL
mgnify:CR=1 FL=1